MSNVIEFGKKEKSPTSMHQFNLSVYADEDGKYEVELEVQEGLSDFDVYIGLLCITTKMEMEHGFEEVDEEFTPANDSKEPVK